MAAAIFSAFSGEVHTCSSGSSPSSSWTVMPSLSSSVRVCTQSVMRTTVMLLSMDDSTSSTQASESPPLYMNISQFCIFSMSWGVGS